MKMSRCKSIQSKVLQQTQSCQFVKTSFSLLRLSWLFPESVTSFNHGFPESRTQQWFPHTVQEKKLSHLQMATEQTGSSTHWQCAPSFTSRFNVSMWRGGFSTNRNKLLGSSAQVTWQRQGKCAFLSCLLLHCDSVASFCTADLTMSLGFLRHIWSPDTFQTLITEHSLHYRLRIIPIFHLENVVRR